jgi:hypothetical protein
MGHEVVARSRANSARSGLNDAHILGSELMGGKLEILFATAGRRSLQRRTIESGLDRLNAPGSVKVTIERVK